jgi:hypothetical protein
VIIFEDENGDQVRRLAPGQYEVRREFMCLGRKFSRKLKCSSPASALRRLDEWEEAERAALCAKVSTGD